MKLVYYVLLGIVIFLLIVIASLNSINEIEISPWINVGLGLASLILSHIAGQLYTSEKALEQAKHEIGEHHKTAVREITARSASELNDFFQNIVTLSKTWNAVAREYKIENTTEKSVNDTLSNMKDVIQSSMNKIISLGGDNQNPYGLYAFSNEADCFNSSCKETFSVKSLQPYPRARKELYCNTCDSEFTVIRDYDGTIKSLPPWGHTPPSTVAKKTKAKKSYASNSQWQVQRGTKPFLLKFEVVCPNSHCQNIVTGQYPKSATEASRGCVECKTTFKLDITNKSINRFDSKIQKVSRASFLENSKIECDNCNHKIPKNFLLKNSEDEWYLNCTECGYLLNIEKESEATTSH